MSDTKMCDDNILYCLQTISGFEPEDIECDDFEIAVNDDQFAQMSIVKATGLGVELIDKLTEQNKMLREALIRVSEWDNMSQEFRIDNGSRGQQRVIVGIAKEALEATK